MSDPGSRPRPSAAASPHYRVVRPARGRPGSGRRTRRMSGPRGPRGEVEAQAAIVPIRRRARCAPDPSPRLRWVVISERGQCNQERTAIHRTSRGSEPGGGGVQFTDTPLPPPPPGSDPGPLWADHGTAKECCEAGSYGPTDTAAPERGSIPCGGPLGSVNFGQGGGLVPHKCASGHARHIPSKRRDWHVPLPWALTGTTRGRHNNRPGRPAGPGPSLRQHHKGGRVGQKQVEETQEGQSTQQQQNCRKCRPKGECLEIPKGIRNAEE